MTVSHNEQEVTQNILLEKWKLESVIGEKVSTKPNMILFNNTRKAIEMLDKHIENNSLTFLHTDVDVDGIGSTFELMKVLQQFRCTNAKLVINSEKEHGVNNLHVKYFEKNPIDFLIVSDSSSKDIETLKSFNCDVLCIDHHDLEIDGHSELLSGKCNDGIHDYVIVNSTLENCDFSSDEIWIKERVVNTNEEFDKCFGTQSMSCGLVVYELLRVLCYTHGMNQLMENLMLYQWAGVTLFTDVIDSLTERNQWYIDKTTFNTCMETEPTLKTILNTITKYKGGLDKTYINYSFAPIINKAIRAGCGAIALQYIVDKPNQINDLRVYGDKQTEMVNKALYKKTVIDGQEVVQQIVHSGDCISLDAGVLGIHKNYFGVIAARICGLENKSAIVYREFIDNKTGETILKGSFRGLMKGIDYRRDAFLSHSIMADGHPAAFGFEIKGSELDIIKHEIVKLENEFDNKPWLTAGRMSPEEKGYYHIEDFDNFRKQGFLWKLAIGNSKVSSNDEINILVPATEVVLSRTQGKVYFYNVLGVECKAYSPLKGKYFNMYFEFSNQIDAYIREV